MLRRTKGDPFGREQNLSFCCFTKHILVGPKKWANPKFWLFQLGKWSTISFVSFPPKKSDKLNHSCHYEMLIRFPCMLITFDQFRVVERIFKCRELEYHIINIIQVLTLVKHSVTALWIFHYLGLSENEGHPKTAISTGNMMTKHCVKRGTRFLHKPISHLIYNRYCIRSIDIVYKIDIVCMYMYIYIFLVHVQYMGSWSRMANNHQALFAERRHIHQFGVDRPVGFRKFELQRVPRKHGCWGTALIHWVHWARWPAVVQKNYLLCPPKPKDMLEFGCSPGILSGIILS